MDRVHKSKDLGDKRVKGTFLYRMRGCEAMLKISSLSLAGSCDFSRLKSWRENV